MRNQDGGSANSTIDLYMYNNTGKIGDCEQSNLLLFVSLFCLFLCLFGVHVYLYLFIYLFTLACLVSVERGGVARRGREARSRGLVFPLSTRTPVTQAIFTFVNNK